MPSSGRRSSSIGGRTISSSSITCASPTAVNPFPDPVTCWSAWAFRIRQSRHPPMPSEPDKLCVVVLRGDISKKGPIMATNPFEDENGTYVVLVNDEGQHSLWPAYIDVPAGWFVAFG